MTGADMIGLSVAGLGVVGVSFVGVGSLLYTSDAAAERPGGDGGGRVVS
ncbi:hypothetical protein HpBGD53_18660 [Helicobacter pylori]